MIIDKKAIFTFLFLALVLPFANAQEMIEVDTRPQPGNTGAHAFSFIEHAGDATIGDQIIIDVKFDGGIDNLGTFQGGTVRIKIPFAHWVEIEANAVTDRWQISEETRAKYGLIATDSTQGLNSSIGGFDADINFRTKIKILSDDMNSARPAVAFQATVKTASGDYSTAHRFTDSAGYEFSVLASKTLMDSDDTIIRKVRLLTEVAFIAWDTRMAQQNDAYKASAALQLEGNGFNLKVSFLTYVGWQDANADHVTSLQIEAAKNLRKNWQIYGQANFGLTKAAVPLLVGAGVRYSFAGPKKKKKFNPTEYENLVTP